MNKTLILLDKNIDSNIKCDLDVIISNNIDDIKNDDVSDIIYIGSYKKYNDNLDLNDIVLVNEAFTKNERVFSSFSLNYYLQSSAQELNKSISIINVLSDKNDDKILQNEMYDKFITLGIDENSYEVLSITTKYNKKASAILKIKNNNNYDDVLEIVLQSLS